MSYMKKNLTRSLLLASLLSVMACACKTASANVVFSPTGVSPTTPSEWNSTTDGYVGLDTGAGAVTITSGGTGSTLASQNGYIGYHSSGTGTVSVDGAGATWTNSQFLYVGGYANASTGALTISNGGNVSSLLGRIAYKAGASGTVTVKAGGTWNNSPSTLCVGYDGTGYLNIQSGGTVTSRMGYIGDGASSNGSALVDGSGSTWANGSSLYVGIFGAGSLNVTNGAAVTSIGDDYIAFNNGAAGTVTVDGAGSTWNHSASFSGGGLYVGYLGYGTLQITNGGLVNNNEGNTYVDCSLTSFGSQIHFGQNGGTLATQSLYASPSALMGTGTIDARGLVSDIDLTFDASATHTVTIAGTGKNILMTVDASDSNNVGDLGAGYWGNNTLTIKNGADVYSKRGILGYRLGSSGTASVDGSGSTWNTFGILDVGYDGEGTLTVTNGAALASSSAMIGINSGSNGLVNIDGTGSTWNNEETLSVGVQGSGFLRIAGGATVTAGDGEYCNVLLGAESGVSGTLSVDGNGSTLNTDSNLYVGYRGAGMLNIINGGSVAVADYATFVGQSLDSAGASSIHFEGGTLSTKSLYAANTCFGGTGTVAARGMIGDGFNLTFDSGATKTIALTDAGRNVSITLDASNSATAGDLGAGHHGNDSLTIQNGSSVYSQAGYLGYRTGSSGTATVDGIGSSWSNLGDLAVGYAGTGLLNITGGAVVQDVNGYVSQTGGAVGTVNINGVGSTWSHSDTLSVGHSGQGVLNVTGGGAVTSQTGYIGFFFGVPGTATVHGAGSTWTNTGNIYVGGNDRRSAGNGTLHIANDGTVSAAGITKGAGGSGTVTFDAGTLKALADSQAFMTGLTNVFIMAGGAKIDTNGHAVAINQALLTDAVSTGGGLTKVNAGTLTLSGNNTYTGATTIQVGTLELVGFDTSVPSAWDPVLTGGGADLQNGRLVFRYAGGMSPGDTVATILDDSYGTANPFSQGNGAQIISTTADANHGLGWIDDGVDEVTVMYTLYGDSNLDGSVNGTDLNAVLSYYNQSDEVWANGDFNYDGSVNGTDLNTVLSNYNQSLSSSTAAVPEPSTLLLMVMGLLGLLAWRKRN